MGIFQKKRFSFKIHFSRKNCSLLHNDMYGSVRDTWQNGLFYRQQIAYTQCKYQYYPTLNTYLSLSFHSDTLPKYLSYPINRIKNNPPYTEHLPHLPHTRHLSQHICTHFTTFYCIPQPAFPYLILLPGLN